MGEQRSISELWAELQQRQITINNDLWTLDHPNHFCKPFVEKLLIAQEKARAELLERCKVVLDANGAATNIYIHDDGHKKYVRSMPRYRERTIRIDDENTAANYIAALSFWRWELEQREKEAQPCQ